MKNKDEKEVKITIEGELRVKELLEQKGIRMKDFASNIGIERETLTRTLKGNPRYDTLKAIADGLSLTVPELFVSYGNNIQKKQSINGFIEIDDVVYSVKCGEQYLNLADEIDGIVHIPSHSNYGFYEGAVRGFCTRSISDGKSGVTMMRYGINEVFTLSYDAESQKFSLTLCIGNGDLKFRQFDIIEYQIGDTLSHESINELAQEILCEIKAIYEDVEKEGEQPNE